MARRLAPPLHHPEALLILVFVGTRPEAIKLRPVVRELAKRKIPTHVVATGQHPDLLAGTGLRIRETLGVPSSNDPDAYVNALLTRLGSWTPPKHVRWVVVQGDTASPWAVTLWATTMTHYPVCHIEAGLRSFDDTDPWPEERYRRLIDGRSTLRCAPTDLAVDNLAAENLTGCCTGNTIVDALRFMKVRRDPKSHVLVTLHRRESFGERLTKLVDGLKAFAEAHPDIPVLWPVHPNPEVQKAANRDLPPNILRRGPLPYRDFLLFLSTARAVVTDSGGVSEETTTLGIPTVITRRVTERPEAVSSGACVMSMDVPDALEDRLQATVEPSDVFGDGHAAERIVERLLAD